MKLSECMIAWTPQRWADDGNYPMAGEIKVGPWPDETGWSDDYALTVGACFKALHDMSPEEHVTETFVLFNALVLRDEMQPAKVHAAMLAIDEYRTALTDGVPGAACNED